MNNKSITRKAHNAIAKQYYETYKDDKSDLIYFEKFLSICKDKILDLGCGMGHYSNYMSKLGFEVTGIDFSSSIIKIAKKFYPNIEFIKHDICKLNIIKNRKFDGIVIAYVVQHLSKEEVLKLFNDLNAHVNNDSKLLMFLRQGNSIVSEIEPMNAKYKYIINEYYKEEIKGILNSTGWEILEMTDKAPVNDPTSLAVDTLVVIAKRK